MTTSTPVLIFVHTRFNHFIKCIQSLKECPESKNTELFISSDFYRNKNEKKDVLKVRDYIKNINGFKKITPILFSKNVGLEYASFFSVQRVFEKYDQIIMSEDDNVFSPLFLTYMNNMMDFYENNSNVFGVSGFSPLILNDNYLIQNDELFASNACCVWGWGTWKSKLNKFFDYRYNENLFNVMKSDLKNYEIRKILDTINRNYYNHYIDCIYNKKMPAFDYLLSFYCVKNNLINIHNNNTYVFNMGHEGSGINNRKNKKISKWMLRKFHKTLPIPSQKIKIKNEYIHLEKPNRLVIYIKLLFIKIYVFKTIKKILRLLTR